MSTALQRSYPLEAEIPFASSCVGCGAPPVTHVALDCSAGVELVGASWRSLLWLPAPACARCAARHRRARHLERGVAVGMPLGLVAALLLVVMLIRHGYMAAPSPLWLLPFVVLLLASVATAGWSFHRGARCSDRRALGIEAGHDHQTKWLRGPGLGRLQLAASAAARWSAPPCPWRPEQPLLRVKNLVQGTGVGLVVIGLLHLLVPGLAAWVRIFGGALGGVGLMMAIFPGTAEMNPGELTTTAALLSDVTEALRGVAWWMWTLYAIGGALGGIGAYVSYRLSAVSYQLSAVSY